MPNQSLGTIRGTIKIDYDGAGIAKAKKDADGIGDSFRKLDKPSEKVLALFGSFAKTGAKVGAVCLGISGGIHVIAAALAIIGPLIGAGLATLPGVLLSGAVAMQVIKVALSGVSTALKDASGDAAKFDKDLESLSPNARTFAKDYKAVLKAMSPTRKAIQDAAFKGLGKDLLGAGAATAGLRNGAVGVASAFGRVVGQILQFATSAKFLDAVRGSLANVTAVLLGIAPAVKPLLSAFFGLAGQAADFGTTLAGPVSNALKGFAGWLSKVNLANAWGNAKAILQPIVTAFSTLGKIIGPIFSTLVGSGSEASGILGALLSSLAKFLGSVAGKNALAALGSAFQAISTGAGQVVLALLQALGPVVIDLAPGIASLAGSIASLLVPAIAIAAPILDDMAKFLSANMTYVGPLALAFAALAGAMKILTVVTAIFDTELGVMDALLTAAGWTLVVAAIAGLVIGIVALVKHWGAVTHAFEVLWGWIVKYTGIGAIFKFFMAIPGALTKAWGAVASFFSGLWSTISGGVVTGFNAVVGFFAALPGRILTALIALPGLLLSTITHAVGQMLFAFGYGIGLIIKEAMAFPGQVVAVFKLLYIQIPLWIYRTWNSVMDAIAHGISSALSAIGHFITGVVNYFIALGPRAGVAIASFVTGIPKRVRSAMSAALTAIGSFVLSAIHTLAGLPGKALSALSSLGPKIKGAFSTAGTWLKQAGKDVIMGLVKGIGDAAGAAVEAAKKVANKVLSGVKSALHINSPSRKFMEVGANVIAGFVKGIQQGQKLPVVAFNGVVRPILASVPRMVSTSSSTASNGNPPPAYHGPYQLTVDNNVFAEFIVDTVTGEPQIISKTTTEGSRKTAWAGSGRAA